MNKEQAESLKMDTCYLIELIEPRLDQMKAYGLPKEEQHKIELLLDYLFKMNKKYVMLSK